MKYALTLFLLSALAGAQVSSVGAHAERVAGQAQAERAFAGYRPAVDNNKLAPACPTVSQSGPLERTLIGLHLASAAFDTGTTVHNLANGCHENNPLLGSHPSTAHVIGFEAGITAGELIAFHFLRKHHPKLAIAFLGESIVEHGVAGGMNTQQKCF